jgi:hypothetical protein
MPRHTNKPVLVWNVMSCGQHTPTGKKAARTESDNRRQAEQVDGFEVLRTAKPTPANQRKEP